MAFESVVYDQYPQAQDPFGYGGCKEFYNLGGGWGYDDEEEEGEDKILDGILDKKMDNKRWSGNWDDSSSSVLQNVNWVPDSSPEACTGGQRCHLHGEGSPPPPPPMEAPATTPGRRKRRRAKSCKNEEELEIKRMSHIAVERNRRKQMNAYLAVIRSLMPASYVQRGDQASIIGGAINFVKELEQLLQAHEAQNWTAQQPNNSQFYPVFADFLAFPQYSTHLTRRNNSSATANSLAAENRPGFADIEVTVVDSHANLKILSKRRPRQLLELVAGLQCLRISVLHLNVTTVDQMVLYSLSIKIEDGCQLTLVDEIAGAVNHLLGKIEEEAALS